MDYRKYTEEDHQNVIRAWEEEREEGYADEGALPECNLIDAEWEFMDLPTGKFPFQRRGNAIVVSHEHLLAHGTRFQEVHAPDEVRYIGMTGPF